MSTGKQGTSGSNFSSGAAAAGLTAPPGGVSVPYSIETAIQNLYSTSANDVAKSLNFIMTKTSDAQADGNQIQFEQYPSLLTAIADLFDVINPSGNLIFETIVDQSQFASETDVINEIFDPSSTFLLNRKHLLGCDNEEFKFLSRYHDDNPLLLSLLGVVRNLSVEVTNETFFAYHTSIMRHLVSIVEGCIITGRILEATQLALETLIFIGGKLEITGSKRLLSSSSYFLEDLPTDPIGSALLRLRMMPAMSSTTSELYERIMNELTQILFVMIDHDSAISRFCVAKGMELFGKLVQNSDNKTYFSKIPPGVISSLYRLLYVQVTNTESIVSEVFPLIGDPLGRSRPPFVPAITNTQGDNMLTFFHDQVDLELRDMALNEIRTLCQISKTNAGYLLSLRNATDLLFQIANFRGSGNVLSVAIRNECSSKAIAILSILATMPEAVPYFRALRTEIITSGCNEYILAEIMCNGVMDLMFPGVPYHLGIPGIPM